MCLGVPGKVIEILGNGAARVDVKGNQTDISIRLTPEVEIGSICIDSCRFCHGDHR